MRIDGHAHNMVVGGEDRFIRFLDAHDLRMNNVCVAYKPGLVDSASPYRELQNKYPERCTWTTTVDAPDWSNIAGWTAAVCRQLSRDADGGACGVKVWRSFGMMVKNPDGSYLMCDDPVLDPIYDCCRKLDLTLLVHVGEPALRWTEGQNGSIPMLYAAPRRFGPFKADNYEFISKTLDFPGYWAQIAARDRILEKHPDLRVVGAHFGSIEHSMNELAARFRKFPNFAVDTSGRRMDAALHDRASMHKIINDFSERLIWGMDQGFAIQTVVQRVDFTDDRVWQDWERTMTDGYRFEQQIYETAASHVIAGVQVTGLGLSRTLLDAFYAGNFKRWYPRAFQA